MIQGNNKNKNEQAYREIMLDSSSSLKDFLTDRRKYHRKYILNEEIADEDSQSITIGRMVETLLLEPEKFDNRFYISASASPPTGLMLAFVEALYKHTKEATDERGNVSRSFGDLSNDAYMDSGFKLPYDTVINKFIGSDAEIYYQEVRTVRANNLTVVTVKDIENAERVAEGLKSNDFTKDVINLVSSTRYSVYNQLQIENYEIDEHPFKGMLDKVIVDHQIKVIYGYDIKCTWAVENFYWEYYLYRKAYIQAYVYQKGLEHFRAEKMLHDYRIEPIKFIVCDSINYYNPLIYALTQQDIDDAYNGFEYKGRDYKGVKEGIEELKWALNYDVWNISKENYELKGIVPLK